MQWSRLTMNLYILYLMASSASTVIKKMNLYSVSGRLVPKSARDRYPFEKSFIKQDSGNSYPWVTVSFPWSLALFTNIK